MADKLIQTGGMTGWKCTYCTKNTIFAMFSALVETSIYAKHACIWVNKIGIECFPNLVWTVVKDISEIIAIPESIRADGVDGSWNVDCFQIAAA